MIDLKKFIALIKLEARFKVGSETVNVKNYLWLRHNIRYDFLFKLSIKKYPDLTFIFQTDIIIL